MRIKKYEGSNEKEIMTQIKDELGPEAMILNVKTIKPNRFLRFFVKDKVEITAAVDEIVEPEPETEHISNVLASIQHLIGTDGVSTGLTQTELVNEVPHEVPNEVHSAPVSEGINGSKIVNLIYEHLLSQDVEPEVAKILLQGTENISDDQGIHYIIRIVYNNVCKMLGDAKTIESGLENLKPPHIIFFIGPTGVGKTTSIAKLTANFKLKKKKDIALITADTYRIAAVEQLKTYADILSVPLEVVYSASDLIEAVGGFVDKDFIFIDTAGRSHKNKEQLVELQEILDAFTPKKVYLVLSSTTKFKDLMSIVKTYSTICDDYSLVVTKTDETTSIGTILNLRYYVGKPLSYVSFGQNVPDDIEVINAGNYAKMLLGGLEND